MHNLINNQRTIANGEFNVPFCFKTNFVLMNNIYGNEKKNALYLIVKYVSVARHRTVKTRSHTLESIASGVEFNKKNNNEKRFAFTFNIH